MKNKYSTVTVSQSLVDEIIAALKTIDAYGSLEIFVTNNMVTQITVRNIKKTGGTNQPLTKFS